ncbi:MAG: FtsQ-type POTRA domain-containing protein [Puniceicoccales bacterium]|jgi:cell division septal protein FtsQ|nr:FtsQ-type POTRA domain-containing protein [Puniceicoccales bacterium]
MKFRWKLKKVLLLLVAFSLFLLLVAMLFFKNCNVRAFFQNAFPRNTLKSVAFSTNGKITAKWLTEMLAVEKDADLFALDIVAMEKKLKNAQQIRKVFIEKRYPDSLFLKIEERIPILKIAASVNGEKKILFIDGMDGKIFPPICYSEEDMIAILPADINIGVSNREKLQFFSLQKVAAIKELVEMLKNDFRDIFYSIKFIDLKNYDSRPGASWSKIELHLKNGIIVSLGSQRFDLQLLRLEYLLNVKCVDNLHRIKRINVASPNDAVIEYN